MCKENNEAQKPNLLCLTLCQHYTREDKTKLGGFHHKSEWQCWVSQFDTESWFTFAIAI